MGRLRGHRLRSAQLRLSSAQLSSTQLSSTQLSSSQLNSTQLNATQRSATQLNSTQLSSAQLTSAQLSSAQLMSLATGLLYSIRLSLQWLVWPCFAAGHQGLDIIGVTFRKLFRNVVGPPPAKARSRPWHQILTGIHGLHNLFNDLGIKTCMAGIHGSVRG